MILQTIRWYLTYALSYRDIEELMDERGFSVDHSTINRWVIHYAPQLEKAFRSKKSLPGKKVEIGRNVYQGKKRMEIFLSCSRQRKQHHCFLLTAKRDKKSALRFFNKAVSNNGQPNFVNIDKSGTNKAAINIFNEDNNTRIKIRQCKYLNNVVEQDHRFNKRITRPMLGFKNFHCAQKTLAGIEVVRMIKKSQQRYSSLSNKSAVELFYALAA